MGESCPSLNEDRLRAGFARYVLRSESWRLEAAAYREVIDFR